MRRTRKLLSIFLILLLIMQVNYEPAKAEALEDHTHLEETSNIEEVNTVNEGIDNSIEEDVPSTQVDTQDIGITNANTSGITVLNSMTEEETQIAKEMVPDFTSDNYFNEMCSNVLSDLEYEEFEADMLSGVFIPTKAIYTIDDVREYLFIKYNGEAKYNELIEEDEDIFQISNKDNVESLLSAQGDESGYIDATSFGPDNPEFQDCRAKNVGVYSSAPISGLRQYTGYDDTLQMYIYVSRILVVRESDEIFVDRLIENAPVTAAGIAGILSWPPTAVAWALWSISAIDTLETTSYLLKPIFFKIPTEYSMIRVIEGSATDNTYTLGQIEMPQLSVNSLITLKVDTYTPSGFIASTHWQEDVYDFGHGVYGEQTYANFAAAYYLEQCNTYGYWPHGANNWSGLYNGYIFPEHQCLYSDTVKHTDYAHIKKCVNGLSVCDVMEAHNYSSNCDDICNDCGFNRSSSSAHNYIVKYTTDKHWKECSDCGDKINEEPHTFNDLLNNKCVLEGCLISHTHQAVSQWTVEGSSHYKKCNDSRCSYHFNEDVHKYDNSCDTICNICWYTRTTTHTLSGVWVVVGTSSMCKRVEVKCTVCGYNTGQIPTSDSSHNYSGATCIDCGYHCPHTYDNACDTTCNICQTTRSITHTYDNACDTTCNVCQATRSITHTYDNACDTTCNICKATRTITHSYSNACDTTCNICEAIRSVPHSYSNDCDTSCNICWYTRTTTHTLSGVWVVVGTSSMCKRVEVKCSVCGYNTGQVPTSDSSHSFSGTTCLDCGYRCSHSYDNACDTSCNICQATRSTTHTYSNACDTSCNACQATRSITHSYSNSCDTTCNVCEATRSVPHSYSNACDTSCNICWYTRTTTHTLSGVWVVVGTSSMCKRVEVKCSVCGYNTGQVPTSDSTHNYSGGYCLDCGYKK